MALGSDRMLVKLISSCTLHLLLSYGDRVLPLKKRLRWERWHAVSALLGKMGDCVFHTSP